MDRRLRSKRKYDLHQTIRTTKCLTVNWMEEETEERKKEKRKRIDKGNCRTNLTLCICTLRRCLCALSNYAVPCSWPELSWAEHVIYFLFCPLAATRVTLHCETSGESLIPSDWCKLCVVHIVYDAVCEWCSVDSCFISFSSFILLYLAPYLPLQMKQT